MTEPKGIVFNIQRYTLDDGPGTRCTVFLKGCPLRCTWCSNPESQHPWPEVTHRDTFCEKCLSCMEVCEPQAISVDESGIYIDRELCTDCGACVEVCPSTALQFQGEAMSVDEVFRVIKKDIHYYQNSGGGVTVSGGEALMQPEFVEALFAMCHEAGIGTCLDTSGYGNTLGLEKILQHTDLVYYDVKHLDPAVHAKYTGQSNALILHNLELVVNSGTPVVIRIPFIPGINDSDDDVAAIAGKMSEIARTAQIHLLPYHRYGMGKYKTLDRDYEMGDTERPSDESLNRAQNIFESYGFDCEIRK